MKLVIWAAAIAILAGAGPAAAKSYGGKDHNFFKAPTAPRPPRVPGERDAERGDRADRPFRPYQAVKPYEGVKEQRHYNIYTNRWE